jgi:hypothetical protein
MSTVEKKITTPFCPAALPSNKIAPDYRSFHHKAKGTPVTKKNQFDQKMFLIKKDVELIVQNLNESSEGDSVQLDELLSKTIPTNSKKDYSATVAIVDLLYNCQQQKMLMEIMSTAVWNALQLCYDPDQVIYKMAGFDDFVIFVLHLILKRGSDIMIPPKVIHSLTTHVQNLRNKIDVHFNRSKKQRYSSAKDVVVEWDQFSQQDERKMNHVNKIKFHKSILKTAKDYHHKMRDSSKFIHRLDEFERTNVTNSRVINMISMCVQRACSNVIDFSQPSKDDVVEKDDSSPDDKLSSINLLNDHFNQISSDDDSDEEEKHDSSSSDDDEVDDGFTSVRTTSPHRNKNKNDVLEDEEPKYSNLLMCVIDELGDCKKSHLTNDQVTLLKTKPSFWKFYQSIVDDDGSIDKRNKEIELFRQKAFTPITEAPYDINETINHFNRTLYYPELAPPVLPPKEVVQPKTEPKTVETKKCNIKPSFDPFKLRKASKKDYREHILNQMSHGFGSHFKSISIAAYARGQSSKKMQILLNNINNDINSHNVLAEKLANHKSASTPELKKLDEKIKTQVAKYKRIKHTKSEQSKEIIDGTLLPLLNAYVDGAGIKSSSITTYTDSIGRTDVAFPFGLMYNDLCDGDKSCSHGTDNQICTKIHTTGTKNDRRIVYLNKGRQKMLSCYHSASLHHKSYDCANEFKAEFPSAHRYITHLKQCSELDGFKSHRDTSWMKKKKAALIKKDRAIANANDIDFFEEDYDEEEDEDDTPDRQIITLHSIMKQINHSYNPSKEMATYVSNEDDEEEDDHTKIALENLKNLPVDGQKTGKRVMKFLKIINNPANKHYNAYKKHLRQYFTDWTLFKTLRDSNDHPVIMCNNLVTKCTCNGKHPSYMYKTAELFHHMRHKYKDESTRPDRIMNIKNLKILMICFAAVISTGFA